MVKAWTQCGLIQFAVAHALDSSYSFSERIAWWEAFGDLLSALFYASCAFLLDGGCQCVFGIGVVSGSGVKAS